MKQMKTKDGSFTFYNEIFQEYYHSVSGALEEAVEKHVKPLNIEDGMKILDFCFGLGYNSIVATKGHKNLKITGLEVDLKIIAEIKFLEVPEEIKTEFFRFRDLAEKLEIKDENNNLIKLIIGDALHTIDQLPDIYYDRVFFDPFSPGKQPEMWSEEIFKKIHKKLKPGGTISTYSCARWIRKNMKKANFIILDGPVVGRKSPGTIGVKKK
jgi:tRNA U34 5-methylaminomethyl-2-thiouridine-forming methyltransferase MnmC